MLGHPKSSWMFHRDEVDLLEEEIEDLYQRHQASTGVLSEMEADVISEQLETEERSEAEMTLTLGPQLLKEDPAHAQHAPPAPEESLSLPELLKRHTRRDPLYEEVFLWSQRVFAFAKKHYVGQTDTSRDMFRVYVNAKMIPIKFATGISEEMMDDLFSLDISEKENELTLLGLRRRLDLSVKGEPTEIRSWHRLSVCGTEKTEIKNPANAGIFWL